MQLPPEKKLKYLSFYMNLWIDMWPKKPKPFDRWLKIALDKKMVAIERQKVEHFTKVCRYCGRQFEENHLDKTKDHIVALSRGGFDVKENRMPCCFDCNQWKADKSLKDWLEEIHNIVKKRKDSRKYPLKLLENMVGRIRSVIRYAEQNQATISLYKI